MTTALPHLTRLVAVLLLAALTGLAPQAAGATRFPRALSGTFSGQDDEYDWWASVTLRRHTRQTIQLYSGRATVHWKFRDAVFAGGRCHHAPAGGSFTYRVELQVNRTPDRPRGWSYAGGGPQGDAGHTRAICAGDDDPVEDSVLIDRVFDVGGFTRTPRRVGGQTREAGLVMTWRLRAHGMRR